MHAKVFTAVQTVQASISDISEADTNITKCSKFEKLKKVLLAVNFNHPHYSAVPHLREFYEPIFGKIIFCGESKDDSFGVIQIEENQGRLGYMCVVTAMKMYPGFIGYIHTNDDVILNWWQLIKLDFTKLWFSTPLDTTKNYVFTQPVPTNWWWWSDNDTAGRCKRAFYMVKAMLNASTHPTIPSQRYLQQYYHNTNNVELCFPRYVDLFYIPQDLVESFVIFAELFAREKLYLEVAMPLAFAFLTNATNHHVMKGVYLPELFSPNNKTYLSGEAFYRIYTIDLYFVHPFKLTGPMKLSNQNIFSNVIKKYGDVVRKDC